MYKTLRVLICVAVLGLTHAVQAQNIGNTPYSRYGLGELNNNLGSIRTAGMGGVGVSAGNSYQANTANPALLYYNSTTVFDLGINTQLKKIKNSTTSQVDGNGNIGYVTIGVPISKRWSSAVSLRPFSAVDYQINSASPLPSNPQATVRSQYSGEGGISELYFGHGVRIANGLTIGASASYLFGTITSESSSLIEDTTLVGLNLERVIYSQRTRYTDFLFRAGANYRKEVKDKLFINAGALYSLKADLDATRETSYERRTIYEVIQDENILPDSVKGGVSVPSSLRAGISVDNGTNLTIGAEFYTQNWSEFRNFEGEQELANSYRIGLGGEYTPDATSVGNYFERVTYRAGFNYGNTPYKINGEQIKDMAVTWGFTMPIGRSTPYDMYQFNTAFALGRRGTTDNNLIQEDYFQFSFGVTINSRWFIKRRLD